jgi:hypothetical protein
VSVPSRARSTSFVAPEDDCPILAMVPVEETIPADLFVMVLEALEAFAVELDQLGESEVELPERVVDRLTERAALLTAVGQLPEETKVKLRELYTAALVKTERVYMSGGSPSVMVPEGLGELRELLRRAALTQPGVDAALRQAAIYW